MKAMKIIGFLTWLILTSTSIRAQVLNVEILYTKSAELIINDINLNGENKNEEITAKLGEPNDVKDYPSGEVSLFYNDLGIVFFTKDGIVRGLGINFNWDGDHKFPETSFVGTLKLGEYAVNLDSKNEKIAKIKQVDFVCPFPIICASKDREAKVNCTIAFKEEKLTQVVFIIR